MTDRFFAMASVSRRGLLTGSLGLLAAATMVSDGTAQTSLRSALSQGAVGERPDGLIGAVGSADRSLQSLIQQTNDARMTRYRQIARDNGLSVQDVQRLAGQRLIKGLPRGQYYLSSSGRWVKK